MREWKVHGSQLGSSDKVVSVRELAFSKNVLSNRFKQIPDWFYFEFQKIWKSKFWDLRSVGLSVRNTVTAGPAGIHSLFDLVPSLTWASSCCAKLHGSLFLWQVNHHIWQWGGLFFSHSILLIVTHNAQFKNSVYSWGGFSNLIMIIIIIDNFYIALFSDLPKIITGNLYCTVIYTNNNRQLICCTILIIILWSIQNSWA